MKSAICDVSDRACLYFMNVQIQFNIGDLIL